MLLSARAATGPACCRRSPETHLPTPLYELVAEPWRLGDVGALAAGLAVGLAAGLTAGRAANLTVLGFAFGCLVGVTHTFLRLDCALGCESAGTTSRQSMQGVSQQPVPAHGMRTDKVCVTPADCAGAVHAWL